MWLNKVVGAAQSKITRAHENLSQVLQEIDNSMEESMAKAKAGDHDGNGDGMEGASDEVYKALLSQFQLDQIKVTKEYQKLFAEKEAELRRVVDLYERKTGEKLEVPPTSSSGVVLEVGEGGEDALKAYKGMDAEQLRAQVEVLLDSVKSWEERVRELLEGRTDILADAERHKIQSRRVEQRMSDMVDRVKLQQSELERYMELTEELEKRRRTDVQTIEGMVQDYNHLVQEAQTQEERQAKRIRELENERDELAIQKAMYEKNILQLIDTQAELERRKREEAGGGGDAKGAAVIEALQRQLAEKEEEIRRIAASSSSGEGTAETPGVPDPEASAKLELAQVENDRLKKDMERTRRALEQAQKAGEKLAKDMGELRSKRAADESAEVSALRSEVTELQARLEAAYKDAGHNSALLQDKLTMLEKEAASQRAAHDAALSEARSSSDKALAELRQSLQQSAQASGNQKVEELEARFNAEKQAMEAKAQEDRQAALQERARLHQEELAALEKAWKAKESEWALERQALAGESGKALSEALDKAEASLSSARAEHEAAMAALRASQQDALAAASKEAQAQLAAARAEHESSLSAVRAGHEEALRALRSSLEQEQARAVQEASDRVAKDAEMAKEQALEAARVSTEEKLRAAVEAEKSAAEAARASLLSNAEADKTQALAALRQELAARITTAEQARDEARAALEKVESVWRAKQDAALQAQAKEMEAAKVRAVEEVRRSMQVLVDEAGRERQEALELYSQESRKRKLIHNKLLELQGNIRVLCRVRPVLPVEVQAGEDAVVTEFPSPEDIVVHKDPTSRARFEFDRVFSPDSTQSDVFEGVRPLITSFLDGYNVCIFAYGQTGSGKTFTMEGPATDRGVNFRALEDLFRLRDERANDVKYTLQLSSLEVYNETIRDLLGVRDPRDGLPQLDIKIVANGEYDVPGLTLVEVGSMDEVLTYMNQGKQNRAVGAHDMNEHSSRSHSILSIRVRGENLHDHSVTTAKLHLIDLAGSERLSKTDATGERLKEAQNINKSLSALGDVINALSSKTKGHVPYRNSKLTFLLQDSLGGNSKVVMFVNISPAAYNVGETVCSLTFAARCRNVQLGSAKKGTTDGEVAKLRDTVEQLSQELALARGGGSSRGVSSSLSKTARPTATGK